MADDGVPWKEYVDMLDKKNGDRFDAVLAGMEKATGVAFDAANAMLKVHNDVVRKAERDAAMYVTRAQLRWAVTAVLSAFALVETALFAWIR